MSILSQSEKRAYYDYAAKATLPPVPTLTPEQTFTGASATPSPTPTPQPAEIPAHISFPAIKLDADIDPVGLEGDAMGVIHSHTVVSWFELSKKPGEQGNMILAAHRRWQSQDGPFIKLGYSKEGDPATITDELGVAREYLVERVERIEYIDPPTYVMAFDGDERVTMITCIGDFSQEYGTAEERIIVILKPVGAFTPDA